MRNITGLIVPCIMAFILLYALIKRVNVFDVFLEGAGEGLKVAVKLLPTLIALMTAVGMFKVSGALDLITHVIKPITCLVGIPDGVIPLMLLKPISGSGSMVILEDIFKNFGPDSYVGRVASVMIGSTETTFYTMAVYFGATKIVKTRHTLPSAVSADIVGFIMSAVIVRLFFGVS